MPYTDDSELPEVTDEQLRAAGATTRPYTLVLLRPGPAYQRPGAGRSPHVMQTVQAHGRRN